MILWFKCQNPHIAGYFEGFPQRGMLLNEI